MSLSDVESNEPNLFFQNYAHGIFDADSHSYRIDLLPV